MHEPDVSALRRRIGRDEFDKWMVAYHALHLDGSRPAAIVANTIHNEIYPAVCGWLDLPFEPRTEEDFLPPPLFGDEPTEDGGDAGDAEADELDALLRDAERRWGNNG